MRLLLAIGLLAAGCPAGLEAQSHVSKLRVLGIKAEPPELIVQPDAGLPSTTLTALAVDPSGAPISIRFALCTDLSGVPSPTLDCPGSAGIDLPDAGPLAARLDLADPRIVELAATTPFDGGSVVAALDRGVPLLIGFDAAADLANLSGFATLTLRTPLKGPANLNPRLVDLQIPEAHAGGTIRLQPIAAEKHDPTERYLFSFFATDGTLAWLHSTDVTATGQPAPTWVEWTAPKTAGQNVRFWVVLRDGRGGVDWLEREAAVK
ncbi:MAG: hypothetical protein LC689_00605 [Myxococcales bacterium]|nr:hypothetical protein [Myxococcales bacterium]